MLSFTSNTTGDLKCRLLDAARLIFARFGYNKTSVDEIARAAGKGKSTFYYYFESKEEIFKAAIEQEADIFRAKLKESITSGTGPLEKIRNYLLTRLLSFKDLVNFYNAIKNEGMNQISFINEIRMSYELEQLNIIKSVLKESVENKLVEINDLDLVSEAMAEILKGLEYYMMFNTSETEKLENKVDGVLKLIFKGINQ